MNFGKLSKFAMALTIGATLAACGNGDGTTAESGAETGSTTATGSGTVLVDGSSTVFPIMEGVAEEFSIDYRCIRYGWRIREIHRRRNRHQQRFTSDQRRRNRLVGRSRH